MTETFLSTCANCARGESEVPLQAWRYQGRALWICSDCLPLLIHKREQLLAKLAAPQAGQHSAPAAKSEEQNLAHPQGGNHVS